MEKLITHVGAESGQIYGMNAYECSQVVDALPDIHADQELLVKKTAERIESLDEYGFVISKTPGFGSNSWILHTIKRWTSDQDGANPEGPSLQAPHNQLEAEVATVWKNLGRIQSGELGIVRDSVGMVDNGENEPVLITADNIEHEAGRFERQWSVAFPDVFVRKAK